MILGAWQNNARAAGRLDPVTLIVQRVLNGPVALSNTACDRTSDFFSGVGRAGALSAENRALKEQLASLGNYSEIAQAYEAELQNARGLAGFPDTGQKKIPAEIIAYIPADNRVTLSAGSKQGVTPNIAVVTARGLLGVVSTVDTHTCQVILVTSGSIKVGGLILGEVPVPGLVKGQSSQRLVMDVFDPVDVKPGSEVVTTGYSEHIPRGIRIGIVSQFYKNEEFGTRFAYVIPSARIGFAKEVYILK